jgi:hypothetical protein
MPWAMSDPIEMPTNFIRSLLRVADQGNLAHDSAFFKKLVRVGGLNQGNLFGKDRFNCMASNYLLI